MADDRTLGWVTDGDEASPAGTPPAPAPSPAPAPAAGAAPQEAPAPRPDPRTRPDVTRDIPPDARATALDHPDAAARIEAQVAAVGDGPAEPAEDPMLGRLIHGRFLIESRIGAGGMGIVYRARQTGIDRTVAIKMLLRELAGDEKVVKRFKIEALAVSRLNHPNTIRIFDFGQVDDGTLYFAMEFLDGLSLEAALRKEGTFPARRALHVMRQIASSLTEAHEKGIVHRDLKPDNVYLTRVGDDTDFVKVLDFGVAKLREADKRQGTVTQAGTIFGTPRYMAPEQCRSMAVDHRADVYAIGVIGYEMLTGHPPFDAENPLAILIQHVQEPPRPMAEVRPDVEVPSDVEELVLKCLEKAPDQRFQSAADLVAALSAVEGRLAGQYERVVYVEGPRVLPAPRLTAEAATVQGPVLPARRRSRAGAFLAAGAAVLLAAGAGGLWASGVLSPAPAEEAPAAAPAAAPAPAPAPPPAAPAVPTVVRMRVQSDPAGAEVLLGGRVLGTAPGDLEVPFGKSPVAFTFRKAGWLDATVEAIPDRDGALSALLKRAPAKAAPGTPRVEGAVPPPARLPAPADGARPVPVPAPAPKKDDGPSRVKDLKTSY